MQIMGTNRWDFDTDPQFLAKSALEFAEMVKDRGIAELHGAWLGTDENVMWCAWDTEDVPALQAAFDEMNRETGLISTLTPVNTFFSTVQTATLV